MEYQLSATTIYLIVSEYKVGHPDINKAKEYLGAKYGHLTDRENLLKTIDRVYGGL